MNSWHLGVNICLLVDINPRVLGSFSIDGSDHVPPHNKPRLSPLGEALRTALSVVSEVV